MAAVYVVQQRLEFWSRTRANKFRLFSAAHNLRLVLHDSAIP